MFEYEATADGTDEFGLRAMLQAYADGYWTPDHIDEQEAATMVLEAFKRKIDGQVTGFESEKNPVRREVK